MPLDCVLRDKEPLGDLAVREPAHHQPENLFFSGTQAISCDVEPGDLFGLGRLYHYHRLAWTFERWLGEGAVEGEPLPRARPGTQAGDEVRVPLCLRVQSPVQGARHHSDCDREPAFPPSGVEIFELP